MMSISICGKSMGRALYPVAGLRLKTNRQSPGSRPNVDFMLFQAHCIRWSARPIVIAPVPAARHQRERRYKWLIPTRHLTNMSESTQKEAQNRLCPLAALNIHASLLTWIERSHFRSDVRSQCNDIQSGPLNTNAWLLILVNACREPASAYVFCSVGWSVP
jgi:hypothetical protein